MSGRGKAQKYMRLAEEWDRLPNANWDSHLETSVDVMLASIAEPRERVEIVEVLDAAPPAPPRRAAPQPVFDMVPNPPQPSAPAPARDTEPGRAEILAKLLPQPAPKIHTRLPSAAHIAEVVRDVVQLLASEHEAVWIEVVVALVEQLDDDARLKLSKRMAARLVDRDIAAVVVGRVQIVPPSAPLLDESAP